MSQPVASSGLVVAAYGRRGILESAGNRMGYITKGRKLRVVCGDRVQFQTPETSEDVLVTATEPRTNVLVRVAQHGTGTEPVAANITQILVVCAPCPAPDWFLVDRYICAAELMDCRAVIVWNKADLGDPDDTFGREYPGLGYPVLTASARNRAGTVELAAHMAAGTSVLVGQSGVGKSSLINVLAPGAEAAIGALSASGATGTHTTTAALMYEIPGDGRLIDTPGARSFVPALTTGQIDQGFVELRQRAPACRFADCTHSHEPGCAVKDAVAAGRISARRYESYQRLLELSRQAQR
ncbi:MAG: ribosome small subunit-dependent GTPase A [Gammaproteobacteria bacterium]|nr:ribosome small subunit-dependent GTPase A [Gammaproteobacteria bacterium]